MEEKSKNGIGRVIIGALGFIIQLAWLIIQIWKLNSYFAYISVFTNILTVIVILRIYGRNMNPALKIPWIVLILVVPIFGLCLYILFGSSLTNQGQKMRYQRAMNDLEEYRIQKEDTINAIEEMDAGGACIAKYLLQNKGYPLYENTDVRFYPSAEEAFVAQKEALERAEKFIFMEYFAIEDSTAFRELEQILTKKAAQGVEIRMLYDDVGSMGYVSSKFAKKMNAQGIKCRVFNPILPFMNIFMNTRDHRKITVIDNKVGFTGGYNLADEYFNLTSPFGHWKDTGVRLEGDAVKSLTEIFLEMWNTTQNYVKADESKYFPEYDYSAITGGFVQPYAVNPLIGDNLASNTYLNMINNAKRYLHITTPYLILDDITVHALEIAAKRGVDVRIVTPGIPDKKFIYQMTRSYYAQLAKEGVRIYEYTPGFVHAKQYCSDDEYAIVGTINMDYRSMFLHFEDAVVLYHCDAVKTIKEDFDQTFAVSKEVTEQYRDKRQTMLRIGQCLLRFIAPLL